MQSGWATQSSWATRSNRTTQSASLIGDTMLRQLSVFAENTRGTMANITDVLARAGINITALITNDSAEYGIVRMIVTDPEKAAAELHAAGYQCKLASVMGVYISDVPGALSQLLTEVKNSGVNVDYLYVSYDRATAAPIAIMHTDYADELSTSLTTKGYHLL